MESHSVTSLEPHVYLGSSGIRSESRSEGYILTCGSLSVCWSKDLRTIHVVQCGVSYCLGSFRSHVLTLRRDDVLYDLSLSDCLRREVSQVDYGGVYGWSLVLAGFRHSGIEFDVSLRLFVGVSRVTSEVLFRLVAEEGGRDVLERCWWPGGFQGERESTIVPFMQGIRIPARWPHAIDHYPGGDESAYSLVWGRIMSMPWFGIETSGGCGMLIVDTADDMGCRLHHTAGGETELETVFVSSLGRMRYPRSARLRIFPKGTYVTMAKSYRSYVQECGVFVSLREKMVRTPSVSRLLGSAIIHGGLLYHNMPTSAYYQPDHPEANHVLTTCEEFGEKLRRLEKLGLQRAYVHVDGWGYRGYDNLEPDSIPIGSECGGASGLRDLVDTCHALGYLVALHQQYRDNYVDAAGYDERLQLHRRDGSIPGCTVWAGGAGTVLCPSFALEYVRRNNAYFKSQGIELDGSYLDVFSVVPLDECFCSDHPVSRRECREYRAACFNYIRHHWGLVSSEEPSAWAVPHLDLVHHAPWPLFPNPGSGPTLGMPIPLFNLVFHDALVIPGNTEMTRGGWGHDERTIPFLSGLLNVWAPYVSLDAEEDSLKRIAIMQDLHARAGLEEMTMHEFLSEDGMEQRSQYANGMEIQINHRQGSWKISQL